MRPDESSSLARPERGRIPMWLLGAVVVLWALIAYLPSFDGAFVYDDRSNILENTAIRQLWPATPWLDTGRRPLVSLTLALNYAAGGLDPFGYHLVNFAVHAMVCLALLGLVRRSCTLLGWHEPEARALAFGVSLLFAVHPLATQGVTYIVQRGESMMALFYVLTLLCLAKSAGSRRANAWLVLSVFACLAGMASKPVMITAPIAALVYAHVFLREADRPSRRARWVWFASLVATVSVLAFWGVLEDMFRPPPQDAATVGFAYKGVSSGGYLLTQGGVILHYLRLVFWPAGLRLDYAWPVASLPGALLAVIPVALMAGASFWFGVVKRRAWAFAACAFFLILAPTSSVVPIKHLAFEHRMYLPLACVITLALLACRRKWRARPAWLLAQSIVLAVPLSIATHARNSEYADPLALWSRNVELEPDSYSARTNYASELRDAGGLRAALEQYREAAALDPTTSVRFVRVGILASELGEHELAVRSLAEGCALIDDESANAHPARARALARERRTAWVSYAGALLRAGDREAAKRAFEVAITVVAPSIPPEELATAPAALASLFQTDGEYARAITLYERALGHDPTIADLHARLGRCLAEVGEFERARASLLRAIELDPDHSGASRVLDAIGG